MKELLGVLTNYKTSLPALLALTCIGLYFAKVIDKDHMETGVATLVALGLLGAKDHTK